MLILEFLLLLLLFIFMLFLASFFLFFPIILFYSKFLDKNKIKFNKFFKFTLKNISIIIIFIIILFKWIFPLYKILQDFTIKIISSNTLNMIDYEIYDKCRDHGRLRNFSYKWNCFWEDKKIYNNLIKNHNNQLLSFSYLDSIIILPLFISLSIIFLSYMFYLIYLFDKKKFF